MRGPVMRGAENAAAITFLVLVALPVVCANTILSSPLYGLKRVVVACDDYINERKKQKRMKTDWRYRIRETSPSMLNTEVWPRVVLKYDQYVRKILAVHELGDIPREVWLDITTDDATTYQRYAERYGTPRYDEVREEVVEMVTDHYVRLYEALHGIKDGTQRIQDIIRDEVRTRVYT